MMLKEKLEQIWNRYAVADPLRICSWKEDGNHVIACHSHYRPATIKVKGSLANRNRH
jgi:hypothetical protein